MKRLTECTKGDFSAGFGEKHKKKTAKGNMDFIADPVKELSMNYNGILDVARFELSES